jgi:hypothetical protein
MMTIGMTALGTHGRLLGKVQTVKIRTAMSPRRPEFEQPNRQPERRDDHDVLSGPHLILEISHPVA